MSLRVSANSTLDTLMSNLSKSTKQKSELLEKLSSAKRVQKASDDSASLARASKLNAHIKSQKQATRNAADGVSFVQTAEGGLSEVSNILIRMRELSIQSASDTISDKERPMLQKEYEQLIQEVDRISKSTSFNGTNVINDNDAGVLHFQIGAFADDSNVILFDTDEAHVSSSELEVDSTSVDDRDNALSSIENIDMALDKVSEVRANMGAIQSRMQHAINHLESNTLSNIQTKQIIEDADLADVTAKLISANLIETSAMTSFSKVINFSKNTLKILK